MVCFGWIVVWIPAMTGNHHRVAAEVISKIERGRPATSVHRFGLAVFRARARSIIRLYHFIPVNALIGRKFGNG